MPVLKRSLIAILAIILVIALAAVAFMWRVQDSPASLSIARPMIERELNRFFPQANIALEDMSAFWDRDAAHISLEMKALELKGEGQAFDHLLIEKLVVTLGAQPLLRAEVKPVSVQVMDAELRLKPGKAAAGSFDYQTIRKEIVDVLAGVFQTPELSDFNRISLNRVNVLHPDIAAPIIVQDAHMNITDALMEGHMAGHIGSEGDEVEFATDWLGEQNGRTQLNLEFSSASLNTVLSTFEVEDFAQLYDGRVDARLEIELGTNPDDDQLLMNFELGSGNAFYPTIYDTPKAFNGLNARLRYKPASDQLHAENIALRFSDVIFNMEAKVSGLGPTPSVDLTGKMAGLDTDILKAYWPVSIGKGAYVWINENIETGQLPDADLSFVVTPGMWASELPADALQFKFGIAGLTAHYNRPMPPLTDAYGTGLLSLDDLVLDIEKGSLAGLDVDPSIVTIGPFASRPQVADVQLNFSGGVQNILLVVDSEPLGYISEFGLDPLQVSGFARAHLSLSIPLLKDLKIEEVAFEGTVDGEDLVLNNIINGYPIENGVAQFTVDPNGLRTVGTAQYQGLAGSIDWYEDFTGTLPHPTKARLDLRLSHEQLEEFGIDPENRFAGYVDTRIDIIGSSAEIAEGQIHADLSQAFLKDPVLGWAKPMGVPAQLKAQLRSMNGKFSLLDAVLEGAGLNAKFDFSADEQGVVLSAETVTYGDNDFSLVAQQDGSAWNILIEGESLDVRPFLKTIYAPSEPDVVDAEPTPWPDLYGTAQLNKLFMANDVFLENTQGTIEVVEDHFTNLEVDGKLNGEAVFHLSLKEEEADVRQLILTSENAGLASKGLDLFTQASGGDLSIQAEIRGRQANMEIDGLGTMKDFRLTEAPVLARILSAASLTGVADLARDGRINFKNVDVPFTLRNGVFDIDKASANGPAIGLTMNGQFVKTLAEANLNGVIVPAYGLNSIINKVPIVGGIITGGKNEGIIAINYAIRGPLTDPELSVNPASMLAPGIFRRIFRGGKPTVDVPELDEEAEAATPFQ